MDVDIRKATLENLEDAAALFNQYRVFYEQKPDPGLARKFLQDRLAGADSEIYLAYIGKVAVGFLQLYPSFSSVSAQRTWILNDLYVIDTFRGKGIATKLLNKAKELARNSGAKGLALETASDNPAQQLYEKLGWVKDEEFLHYLWKV